MVSGRVSPEDFNERSRQLDEWSKKSTATALCQFCNELDTYPQKIYEWRDISPLFAETLKKAKCRIAQRLRSKIDEGTTNYGLFMSELGFHDQFYHDYHEYLKDKDAERKKGIEGAKQSTYNIMVPNDLAIGSNIPAASVSNTPDQST